MDRTHIDAPTDGMPGLPRDDHLQRALRHAPDRDLRAPPLLSAAILAAARRAAEPARARRQGWRAWLAAPWAGAGTVAAVLLVSGVLWVQRDALPPAVAPTEEPADAGAVATAGRADPLKVTATVPAPAPRIEPASREAQSGAAPSVVPPTPRPAALPAMKSRPAEIARANAPVSPVPTRESPAAAAAPAAMPPAAAQAPQSPSAAPPSPAMAADETLARTRAWRPGLPGAATAAAAAPRTSDAAGVAVPSPAPPMSPASPVSPEAATAWSPFASDAGPRPLPAGWLQRLAAATPTWGELPAGHGPLAGARSLRLWRNDEAVIWLLLAPDRVQWCSAATGCRVAVIEPTESAALSAALSP